MLSRAVSASRVCRKTKPKADGRESRVPRDPKQRRAMATDPWAYVKDVLGYTLTKQQEDVFDAILKHEKLLIPAAQNLGKTFISSVASLWRFDCWGELLGPDGRPQGCRLLLGGPSHGNVMNVYREMLVHAARAESRGFGMPGRRSEVSVYWTVPGHPTWHIEPVSPPKTITQQQAHRAAGRHHVNQHAVIEEGNGFDETNWKAIEGVCSGHGNTIISPYNPTEQTGPALSRESGGEYYVLRLSGLDHPNVQERRPVIPAAISHLRIDSLVRNNCQNMGAFPGTPVIEDRGDFVYALPAKMATDPKPRKDGIAGHTDYKPHVFRPDSTAEVSILGRTASSGIGALFHGGQILAAFARAKERTAPGGPPASVGLDPARFGADSSRMAPRWGEGAEALLRAYAAAQELGPEHVALLRATRRAYIGPIELIHKADGPETAEALVARWPGSPYSIDDEGVGASVYDHARRLLRAQAFQVSFAAAPPGIVPGTVQAENMRAFLYICAAYALRFDLVDVWPDEMLKQELLAHTLIQKSRTIEHPETHRVERVTSYLLIPKEDVISRIGRSPDRADAFVLALADPLVSEVGTLGAVQGDAQKLAATYRRQAREGMFSGRRPR